MTKTTLFVLLALVLSVLSSCKVYHIPVDNFRKLYEGMGPDSLNKEITIRGPSNEKITYITYPIDSIYATDRKGNPVVLENTPTLRVEIVFLGNQRSVINFQLLRVSNDRIGLLPVSKQEMYYDMLSPASTRFTTDTLTALENNRVRSSYYTYGNAIGAVSRSREIPISEIKKITILRK